MITKDQIADRRVLTPTDEDGNKVPPSNNKIHPRQSIVAKYNNKEIDKDGNIIEIDILPRLKTMGFLVQT